MDRNRLTTPLTHADPELYWQVLNRRLRLAFISGAEAHSRRTLGRGLTDEELRRIIARFRIDATGM